MMIEDIRDYAKENGQRIINEDRPFEFRIGFRCAKTEKTWWINIENMKESLQILENDSPATKTKKELVKGCLPSQGGRLALLQFLNNKT